jgi:hypothetical protein
METMGTFILNTKKKFLTFSYKKKTFLAFSYKKKKMALQDIKLDSDPVATEDLKNISKIILQDNQKIVQKVQKEFDKVIVDKDEEISCLKNHSQNLIAQIKKLKGKKKSQQETLKQLTNKKSLIDKETMSDPIEIKKSSAVKIQVAEKGTNIDPINITTQEGANFGC